MPDRRRLVTKNEITGTVTVVRDLEDGSTLQSVRDSWIVTPGARKPMWAQSQRRYGGARQAGETHDNGMIGWKVLVYGATADLSLAAVEALLGDLEAMAASVHDVFVEWRPDGATVSTYYEVRGPAVWQPDYSWTQFSGAGSIVVDIKIPVGPLAHLDAYELAIESVDLPAVVSLSSPVTGNAPALASISLRTSAAGTDPAVWALLGWTRRPGSPSPFSLVPFGVLDSYSGATGFAAVSSGLYRGGAGIVATASGAGSARVDYNVDSSVMQADEFTPGETQLEVWARVLLADTLVSPRLTLSLVPAAGPTFGVTQFSAEHGARGKLVTLGTSPAFRIVKLGTLSLPIEGPDPTATIYRSVRLEASWEAGSTGDLAVDYVLMVPARQRALGPTGKPNDETYPRFMRKRSMQKTIAWDLSGRVTHVDDTPSLRDTGLGGSLIELPVGDVDLLLKLSSLVPDDPTVDAASEQLAHEDVTGTVRITPRVYLAG